MQNGKDVVMKARIEKWIASAEKKNKLLMGYMQTSGATLLAHEFLERQETGI